MQLHPPRGFHEDRETGQLACPHRDISCCQECAKRPEVVEVLGQHFWVPDEAAQAELRAQMAASAT